MFFVLIVSLYTSRVVLNTLGVDDYGVYNVVAGFVSMFGFLNATLSSSMQRFYNYEGTKDKVNGYKKVYSTGLIIHVILGILLFVVLESFGLWYVNNIMVVPDGRLLAANIVYQVSIISMFFVILQIPYTGALMADERMDFYAIVSIIDVVLKLLAIIALPYLPWDKLIVYGLLLLFITVFNTLSYFIYSKKTVLRFKIQLHIEKELLKSILSFSGWNLLGTFAFLLKGQGLNMLLNSFFGTAINAARGIAHQVNGAINGFSANLATAFRPQIVNSYAASDYNRTRRLFFIESKICFALLCMLMIPVIVEIDYLLRIWLGDIVPKYTNIFAILVLFDSLVCTLNAPCTQVAFAVGNLKKYQIITSLVNLCLLPSCWVCLKIGFSSVSVFIATIVFSIINQTICLLLLNKLFPFGLLSYLKEVIIPCIATFLCILIIPYLIHTQIEIGFIRLLLVGIADITMSLGVVYYVILSPNERNSVTSYILNKIHNYKITIIGTNKGEETVSAGGIDLVEINSKTMEFKKYPHLYAIGEILNIDGFCGGFNLQNAWSTAYVAAETILSDK